MDKTIAIAELQKDIEQILDDVVIAHTPYVLMREDKPIVVMLAYEDYAKMLSHEVVIAQFKETWAAIGARNARYSEAEVEADLELATQEVRARRRRTAL